MPVGRTHGHCAAKIERPTPVSRQTSSKMLILVSSTAANVGHGLLSLGALCPMRLGRGYQDQRRGASQS